jgi:hypothetical protein
MKQWIIRSAVFLTTLMFIACTKSDTITLRNEQFSLVPVGNSNISGTMFIAENMDSSFNVTIKLNSSVKDSVHVMNIYNGDQLNSGNISVKLSSIRGTGGAVIGETKNIKQAIEMTGNYALVTYDKVFSKSLMVKVFLSEARMDSLLCRGLISK